MKQLVALVLAPVLFAACSAPGHRRGVNQPHEEAAAATRDGHWENARQAWMAIAHNQRLAPTSSTTLCESYFEWGKASGVTGRWEEAEEMLLKALDICPKMSPRTATILGELGRLNHARGRHELACTYFNRALPDLRSPDRLQVDPLGTSTLLEDYSESLALTGQTELGRQIAREAQGLREEHPGAPLAPRTPYGKFPAVPLPGP